MTATLEISPQDARTQLAKDGTAVLIDVREPEEFAVARIEGAVLVPMRSVPAEVQKLENLSDASDLLVLCHHGVRSLQVTHWLRELGIENVWSIAGGIDRWSREVDSAVPTY